MGVCYASHLLLSFASRVRWGCAVPATSSHRSRLAFDKGVLWYPPPSVVRVSRPIGCVLCQPPVVRVSRPIGCGGCALAPTSIRRSRLTSHWMCGVPATRRSRFASDWVWRVCIGTHLHPSFASHVPLDVWCASHPSFASRIRLGVCGVPATSIRRLSRVRLACALPVTPTRRSRLASDWVCGVPAGTCCPRLAFDVCVLCQPPPSVVRVSLSIGRAVRGTTSTPRLHLAFGGCPPTIFSHSRLAFSEVGPCQSASPPVVRVCSYHLAFDEVVLS